MNQSNNCESTIFKGKSSLWAEKFVKIVNDSQV